MLLRMTRWSFFLALIIGVGPDYCFRSRHGLGFFSGDRVDWQGVKCFSRRIAPIDKINSLALKVLYAELARRNTGGEQRMAKCQMILYVLSACANNPIAMHCIALFSQRAAQSLFVISKTTQNSTYSPLRFPQNISLISISQTQHQSSHSRSSLTSPAPLDPLKQPRVASHHPNQPLQPTQPWQTSPSQP